MVLNIGNLERQSAEWKKWLLRKSRLYFCGFSNKIKPKYKHNLRWTNFLKKNRKKYQQNF